MEVHVSKTSWLKALLVKTVNSWKGECAIMCWLREVGWGERERWGNCMWGRLPLGTREEAMCNRIRCAKNQ